MLIRKNSAIRRAAVGVTAFALTLASCGSEDQPESTSGQGDTTQQEAEPIPEWPKKDEIKQLPAEEYNAFTEANAVKIANGQCDYFTDDLTQALKTLSYTAGMDYTTVSVDSAESVPIEGQSTPGCKYAVSGMEITGQEHGADGTIETVTFSAVPADSNNKQQPQNRVIRDLEGFDFSEAGRSFIAQVNKHNLQEAQTQDKDGWSSTQEDDIVNAGARDDSMGIMFTSPLKERLPYTIDADGWVMVEGTTQGTAAGKTNPLKRVATTLENGYLVPIFPTKSQEW